jgi:hypothetical protein
MKTKLISFIAFLMLTVTVANAQGPAKSRLSFAILGGINLQNLTGTDFTGDKLENDMLIGYHVGVNVQIPILPEFFFQPGLVFSTKGAKSTFGSLTSSYKISYVELPLNFMYKGSLGEGFVMIGFGPYVGYGIGGKVVTKGGDVTLDTPIEFSNTVDIGDPLATTYFKAFDAGGNIFAGYEMAGGLFAQMNVQLGMIKINPEDQRILNDETSIKNSGFGFSLGYRF